MDLAHLTLLMIEVTTNIAVWETESMRVGDANRLNMISVDLGWMTDATSCNVSVDAFPNGSIDVSARGGSTSSSGRHGLDGWSTTFPWDTGNEFAELIVLSK